MNNLNENLKNMKSVFGDSITILSPNERTSRASDTISRIKLYGKELFTINLASKDNDTASAVVDNYQRVLQEFSIPSNKAILLLDTVSSTIRNRLANEYGVNFISRNRQVFINTVDMCVRFDEHIPEEDRRETRTQSASKPNVSESRTLIVAVLENLKELTAGVITKHEKLQYTAPVGAKIITRFEDWNLGSVNKIGRENIFCFHDTGITLFKKHPNLFSSPVQKRKFLMVSPDFNKLDYVWFSGNSALKKMSVSAPETDSAQETVAIYANRFDELIGLPGITTVSDNTPGATEVEIWKYDPKDFAEGQCVGYLPLLLSLKKDLRTAYEDLILEGIYSK